MSTTVDTQNVDCRGCKHYHAAQCHNPYGCELADDGTCFFRVETDLHQLAVKAAAYLQRGASLENVTEFVQYHLGRLYIDNPPATPYRQAYQSVMALLAS